MNLRSTPSLPVGEPPPLPSSIDSQKRLSTLFAAIVAGVTLLLVLLVVLLLNEPSSSTTSLEGNENEGSAKQNTTKSFDTDQPASETFNGRNNGEKSHQTVVTPLVDDPNLSDAAGSEDSDAAEISKIRADQEPVLPASEQQVENVSPEKQPNSETIQPPNGNQFFTLGGSIDPVRRPAQAEKQSPQSGLIGDAFSGRVASGREEMLREYGGTAATEAAVKLGLEWLAKNQRENGLWSLVGPYDDGSPMENDAAATAMALLAFLGAGHTHQGDRDDPFTQAVVQGSNALLKRVVNSEDLTSGLTQGSGYAQAMCTIALCELYGMTHDRKFRAPALQAVEYCVMAQSPQGGWRYQPRQDSDTSVTGWFVMGLQSARMAGIRVHDKTFNGVSAYLDAAGNPYGSRYSYQPGVATTPSMTAEALLCRQYLGWQHDDPRLQDGAQYLIAHLPEWESTNRDVYYWYYATQVCHHMGGDYWQQWNSVMRESLPANQIKDGQERGSWDPRGDARGAQGGRLYTTCMCLYMLEVYYRHLPLYQEGAVNHRP